jgi:O-antigen/teichoic acid export membrane protein
MLSIVRLDFFVVGLRSSVNKFVQAIILIYFFSIGDLGLKQLILSIVIASAISTVIVLPYFIKTYNKWNNIALGKALLIGEIFVKYGLWDIMRQISTHTANRIKPWLVKLFVGTEAVAVYSIAELTVSSFQDLLPSKTLQSLIPIWLQDKKLSIKMFSYGVKYFMLTGLVIALFALAIVPIIISNFFPKYNESLPLFYFLIISIPVFGIGIIVGNYIVALRRQKFLFIQHLSRSIFSTVLILVTIPFIGLWGLAIEYVLTPIMMVFSSYIYAKKRNAGFSFDLNIIFSFKREDAEIFKKILNIMYNSMVNTFSFLKR